MCSIADKQDFDEETRELFSKLYGRKITEGEVEEIKSNIFRLIEILKDIDQSQEGVSHG